MDCCGITEKKNNSEVSNKKENELFYLICDTFMLVLNLNFIQEVCINLDFPIEYLIIEINNPRETSFKYIRDIMYVFETGNYYTYEETKTKNISKHWDHF